MQSKIVGISCVGARVKPLVGGVEGLVRALVGVLVGALVGGVGDLVGNWVRGCSLQSGNE